MTDKKQMKKNQTVWAYELLGQDDDSYMLGKETYKPEPHCGEWHFGRLGQPHPATCALCGAKVDPDYVNPAFRVRKRRRDITATYDGYLLVSQRLRKMLEAGAASGGDFVALPADPDFFWLRPHMALEFAAEDCAEPCPSCRQFADEVVPTPVFLTRLTEPLASGAYRSSVEFGSVPLKSFLVVLGVHTARAIQAGALAGGYLRPISPEST